MGLLDNLKGMLGMNQNQQVQAAPVATPAVAQPVPVAQLVGALMPDYLTQDAFTPGNQVLGQWSALATFHVSPDTLLVIPSGKPYRLYVRANANFAGANAGAAGAQTRNVVGLAQSTRNAPALPQTYTPDVQVWCKVGAVWSLAPITAINYITGAITYTEPALCTNVFIAYIHNQGEWRFRVRQNRGASNEQNLMVLNGTFAGIHGVNQDDARTAPRTQQDIRLTDGFDLNLEVNSTLPMAWDTPNLTPASGHLLQLRTLSGNIKISDRGRLQDLVVAGLKTGQ